MKIFQIVPDVSYEANGVTPVINGLSSFFVKNGDQVSVCALGAAINDPNVVFLQARRSSLIKINEYSPDFSIYLKQAFRSSDIVHGHSLWSSANLSTGIHASKRTAKLVISPHGTLTKYALSRRKLIKKVLWPIQRLAIDRADLLHATALSEIEDIRNIGYRGPVALIPNGVEVPDLNLSVSESRKKQILFLSRIHPIKGVENLLRAWERIGIQYPDWELVIAGVGEADYEASLLALSSSLKLKRVRFVGPVYGREKAKLYKESSLFVLPSYSENFGMVVAEALACGLPCVVSKGAPWSILDQINAGWWIDNDVDVLSNVLNHAIMLPESKLREMGLKGREYVQNNYSWHHVGGCFNDAYNWIAGNGKRPEFIFD